MEPLLWLLGALISALAASAWWRWLDRKHMRDAIRETQEARDRWERSR